MLTLFSVFSDHALYQAESWLTLRGLADAGAVCTAAIRDGDKIFSECSAAVGADGHFSVDLYTPKASYKTYEITVTDGKETVLLHDILFGEFWMASGQSNMELTNRFQPECPEMLEALKGHHIRIFKQEYGAWDKFSIEPEDTTPGKWLTVEDSAELCDVSACATAWALDVIKAFEAEKKEIPVGYLNVSWGGTQLEGWIPLEAMLADAETEAFLRQYGMWSGKENWNKRDDTTWGNLNYQQISAMYNRKIAPVRGARVRGILWYQGEGDCGHEHRSHFYGRLLSMYHDFYKKEFAADEEHFPMLSSLLYPWVYGESGETRMGYVNRAFVDTAVAEPEKFIFCPLADLPPVWGANQGNHPIHPTHKYRLGARMARLSLANAYGAAVQPRAATPVSCERDGGALILKFRDVGSGLSLKANRARPLYIAGADGLYLPADCEILDPDTLKVWHPYLEAPVHCAYCFNSFEPGATLWAGDYPVAPFATDRESTLLHIEAKPFTDFERTSTWEPHSDASGRLDFYYHPIWRSVGASEVCFDDAFVCAGETRSVRVSGSENPFAAAVKSFDYGRLDLENYASMELKLYHRGTLNASLEIVSVSEDGAERTESRPMVRVGDAEHFFGSYSVDLSGIAGKVSEIRFVFSVDDDQHFCYVNIGKIVLVPKKNA